MTITMKMIFLYIYHLTNKTISMYIQLQPWTEDRAAFKHNIHLIGTATN